MADKPKFEDAPGLGLRRLRNGHWEARWQARHDLVLRGFLPKSIRLWEGTNKQPEPTDNQRLFVSEQCRWYQDEMLAWGKGTTPEVVPFDGTLAGLISAYQTNKHSTYHKSSFHIRLHKDNNLLRIAKEHGDTNLAEIKGPTVLDWHQAWLGPEGRHVAMAHALVNLLRTIVTFGLTILEDKECERLCNILSKMKFQQSKPPVQWLTVDQADAIRATAHAKGWHSIAIAQAFQFECMLRQKDVIGEWIPQTEPELSDYTYGNEKWLRGLKWNEIDGWILRHATSKSRGRKKVEFDLRLAPMVKEELEQLLGWPKSGPIIINEYTNLPYTADEFRRKWRIVARAAGVPDHVKNMDSRSGGITEATNAGVPLEHVRHAATHSDISMTQRYSRDGNEKTENVMRGRIAYRNKAGTTDGKNE